MHDESEVIDSGLGRSDPVQGVQEEVSLTRAHVARVVAVQGSSGLNVILDLGLNMAYKVGDGANWEGVDQGQARSAYE